MEIRRIKKDYLTTNEQTNCIVQNKLASNLRMTFPRAAEANLVTSAEDFEAEKSSSTTHSSGERKG